MKLEQKKWTKDSGWTDVSAKPLKEKAQLVLAFGGRAVVSDQKNFDQLKSWYPDAHIVTCSTAGEILQSEVLDDSLVVTAIHFEKTLIQVAQMGISNAKDSGAVGTKLASLIKKDKLTHVMVFSEGLIINGTDLVEGLLSQLPKKVSVTGGLVGDGADFKLTVVGLDGIPTSGKVVVIGFYGEALRVGYGSLGGWDPFGPDRIITKSEGNVLYEFDGEPALDLYKKYLGEKAAGLPGTGLLFPLNLMMPNQKEKDRRVVRTLLAIDEKAKSMTFAGDMPQGAHAQLMKANFDRLIDGAGGAASMSVMSLGTEEPELAILISCIGRKLVLKSRVDEEVEAVREKIGRKAAVIGFYSYGEICPTAPTERQCQLHNQTMTITTFKEV